MTTSQSRPGYDASAGASADAVSSASLAICDRIAAVAGQAIAWREHAEKLRAAICWLEQPFVDESTTEAEIRQRIRFMVADAERADALLDKALGASPADTTERSDRTREEP